MEIVHARSEEHLAFASQLFREYAEALGIDLRFQDFERELADLPGAYAPPAGRLLVALIQHQPVGCVALRKLAEGICEMKRLYVRPAFRGRGVGRTLAEAVIEEARRIGYERMRLDSLRSLKEATALYRSLGFGEIPPYTHNPIPDAVFLELAL
jgi:GNAT superfamily N-acetyltransferase